MLVLLQAMCAILQCGPMFDANGLSPSGYLYGWLQIVLNSPKEKVNKLLLDFVTDTKTFDGVPTLVGVIFAD